MPIYEYSCSNCGQKTDILHGIHDPVPPFCPECGAEGTLRKGFAPPAIVFKGSGWAKKDRAATRKSGSSSSSSASGSSGEGSGTEPPSGGSESKTSGTSGESKTTSADGATAAD
jgi:putative FmdB family regulatory protein